MIPADRVPRGYVVRAAGGRALIAAGSLVDALLAAGLDDPAVWERHLSERKARDGAGRGAAARLELDGGTRVVLKKMRRGGMLAALWRDRYPGSARLLDNLRIPLEARRRGVATPRPLALLLRRRGPGLYEAWLATEELGGAIDLLAALAADPVPDPDRLAAATAAVRTMHDAGVEHRDLNLGNVMLRGERDAFVIDLDRARLHPDSLPFGLRRAGVRRLERSYLKRFGDPGPLGERGRELWYELYAGSDTELARRFASGRRADRLVLALHRLGRRRGTPRP
jgi:3-deoxy-D-manno-octulosonic acid kinase